MRVREAYRDVTHECCAAHYDGTKPLPADAPVFGPILDARRQASHPSQCDFCLQQDASEKQQGVQ